MLPAIFLFVMTFFLPESPRWLARNDRWEDCHSVLSLVHGKGDPNHPFVEFELQDIREMCKFEARNKHVSYLDLFKPRMLNRTMIGLFMQIWSQLTGMNVMSKWTRNPQFDVLFMLTCVKCITLPMYSPWLASAAPFFYPHRSNTLSTSL